MRGRLGEFGLFCRTKHERQPFHFVIPAKAGIQAVPKQAASNDVGRWAVPNSWRANVVAGDQAWDRLDSRLRGNDGIVGVAPQLTAGDSTASALNGGAA